MKKLLNALYAIESAKKVPDADRMREDWLHAIDPINVKAANERFAKRMDEIGVIQKPQEATLEPCGWAECHRERREK